MKKTMAFVIIVVLLIDLNSCRSYIYISNKQDYETYQDKKYIYAMDLITNRDSTIFFSSEFPGRLSNDEVIGPRHVLLDNFISDSIFYNKKLEANYVQKDNIRYKVIHQNDTILVCMVNDTTRISFSRNQTNTY